MAKELLSVREEEAKVVLGVRIAKSALDLIDGYAKYTHLDRSAVIEALAGTLAEMPSAVHWYQRNGHDKNVLQASGRTRQQKHNAEN